MDKKSIVLLIISSIVFVTALIFAIWSFSLDLNVVEDKYAQKLEKNLQNELLYNEESKQEESKTKDFSAIYTDFEAEDAKGKKIKLSDYKNVPVVVLFFSEKNDDSIEMLNKIDEQCDLYKETIKFIGISADEETNSNLKNVKVPIYYDKDGEIRKSYKVTEFPTILYIDKYNEIFNAKTGLSTTDALKANLDILAENY